MATQPKAYATQKQLSSHATVSDLANYIKASDLPTREHGVGALFWSNGVSVVGATPATPRGAAANGMPGSRVNYQVLSTHDFLDQSTIAGQGDLRFATASRAETMICSAADLVKTGMSRTSGGCPLWWGAAIQGNNSAKEGGVIVTVSVQNLGTDERMIVNQGNTFSGLNRLPC